MKCNTIHKTHNCGKCMFSYSDIDIFEKTYCEQICKISASMLFCHRYNNDSIDIKYSYNVKISCIGTVYIMPTITNLEPDISVVIDVYSIVLSTWCAANNNDSTKILNDKVVQYLCYIQNIYDINKVRQHSIQLVREIQFINKVDRNLISFIPLNDLSMDNLSILYKLSYIGIVRLIYTILNKVKDLESTSLFINLRKCSISSEGLINISSETESCESTTLTAKILYSKYLNNWCKNNFSKVSIISKLKKSIDKTNRCKNIYDISDNCSSLLKELESVN